MNDTRDAIWDKLGSTLAGMLLQPLLTENFRPSLITSVVHEFAQAQRKCADNATPYAIASYAFSNFMANFCRRNRIDLLHLDDYTVGLLQYAWLLVTIEGPLADVLPLNQGVYPANTIFVRNWRTNDQGVLLLASAAWNAPPDRLLSNLIAISDYAPDWEVPPEDLRRRLARDPSGALVYPIDEQLFPQLFFRAFDRTFSDQLRSNVEAADANAVEAAAANAVEPADANAVAAADDGEIVGGDLVGVVPIEEMQDVPEEIDLVASENEMQYPNAMD